MVSNEELVAQIQAGNRDKLPVLWDQTERFIAQRANQLLTLLGDGHGLEFDDLYNSGYLALVAAVDSYDPAADRSFIGWLALHLKTSFAETGGWRTPRQARDPLHLAASLDAPVGDEPDGATLGDFQIDPTATQAFDDAEDRLWQQQLHDALEEALGALDADQQKVLRLRYYEGMTQATAGKAMGLSAQGARRLEGRALGNLRRPKIGRNLQDFVEARTPFYRRWSVQSLERTTEMLVLQREQLEFEAASKMPRNNR